MDLTSETYGYKRRLVAYDIIARTASVCEVPMREVFTPSRREKDVTARHLAMYLIKQHTDLTYEEIGDVFGRDHSTVINGVQRVHRERNNMDVAMVMQEVQRLLNK